MAMSSHEPAMTGGLPWKKSSPETDTVGIPCFLVYRHLHEYIILNMGFNHPFFTGVDGDRFSL